MKRLQSWSLGWYKCDFQGGTWIVRQESFLNCKLNVCIYHSIFVVLVSIWLFWRFHNLLISIHLSILGQLAKHGPLCILVLCLSVFWQQNPGEKQNKSSSNKSPLMYQTFTVNSLLTTVSIGQKSLSLLSWLFQLCFFMDSSIMLVMHLHQ